MRALLTKKIQVEKEKFKIRCLWTQLNFIQGLIEFMKGLIARKLIFLSQFSFLLEVIKVIGSNYNVEELIWSNQGFNYIIIEVWWLIRDLIEIIRTPGTKPKTALK